MSKSRDLGEFPAAALDIDASGNLAVTGDVSLADNDKLLLGDGDDLQIYHDGANSYISELGTGDLVLQSNGAKIGLASSSPFEWMVEAITDGEVKLYHNGSSKLTTTSTGIDVTGTVNGRDVSTDGTKLDTIETSADVTDTANVTASGALMDSELASITSVKALNQGVATTDDPTFTNTHLAAIDATIAATAVDTFVYDTRKDSDGGAWRKRTQHTSWYNETLNTATRGSRKEFPVVAVIVAETDKVTIYDGGDPAMPMWMVFIGGGIIYSNDTSSVYMLNGLLCTGNGFATGVQLINFLSDSVKGYRSESTTSYQGNWRSNIAGRNLSATNWDGVAFNPTIVNGIVNDVAMTVLPNAPIDSATGLPIPTIAVATNGGVSVIKDDGSVVDITWSNEGVVSRINFTSSNNIQVVNSPNSTYQCYVKTYSIPTSDVAEGAGYQQGTALSFYTSTGAGDSDLTLVVGGLSNAKQIPVEDSVGSTWGLSRIDENPADYTKGSVAYITSDYNTGWMNGDIKLATLSDTDATDVVGTELVTNGTFDSDTGWTKGAGWTISGGKGVATNATIYSSIVSSAFATVTGETYVATVNITDHTGGSSRLVARSALGTVLVVGGTASAVGSYSETFVAVSTSSKIEMQTASVGATFSIDNISVRLAEEDRSVNGNGLQVFGTVTKTPVATGADLVGYSGWSASNYLQQPNGLGSEIGVGDFCFMGWMNRTNMSGTQRIIVHAEDSANARAEIYADASNTNINFYTREAGASSNGVTGNGVYSLNTWVFVTCVRRGTSHEIYINGKLITTFVKTVRDISTTSGRLTLGVGNYTGSATQPFQGSLALWRVSATAPTAEQIAKIYNDEKPLFQANAQATLYGTSDAVTALAYDDDTELLHAGTSSGRSVFQGLRRVSNTTDAVTTSISASNSIIVEE